MNDRANILFTRALGSYRARKQETSRKCILSVFLVACLFLCCMLCACGGSSKAQDDTNMVIDNSNAPMQEELDATQEIDYSALQEEIEAIIVESSSGGEVAVTFIGLGDRRGGFDINGSKPMASASMIKMAILADLFAEIEAGDISLDQSLTVSDQDVVGGAGTGIQAGQALTIRELARRMIYMSDNTASNVLISQLGIEGVNDNAERLGLDSVLLDHKLMSENFTQDNLASSNDLATIFEWIAEGTLANPDLDEMAESFLIEQDDKDGLFEGVPSRWSLGHKTGSLTYARNDGGILYDSSGDAACVLVVLTNHMGEGAANALLKRISSTVCNYLDSTS